jgi:hypothetical protein
VEGEWWPQRYKQIKMAPSIAKEEEAASFFSILCQKQTHIPSQKQGLAISMLSIIAIKSFLRSKKFHRKNKCIILVVVVVVVKKAHLQLWLFRNLSN